MRQCGRRSEGATLLAQAFASLAVLVAVAPIANAGVISTPSVQIESLSTISGGGVWIELSQPVSCETVGGPAGTTTSVCFVERIKVMR